MNPWLKSNGLEISVPSPQETRDWLYVDWRGWHTAESVQEGCEAILACVRSTGLTKVLNDNTNGIGDWLGAADWTAQNWFPRMIEAGVRRFAWVESPSRLSRRAADRSVTEAKLDDVIHRFTDRETAEAFLTKQ